MSIQEDTFPIPAPKCSEPGCRFIRFEDWENFYLTLSDSQCGAGSVLICVGNPDVPRGKMAFEMPLEDLKRLREVIDSILAVE